MVEKNEAKSVGYFLGFIAKIVMAVAMLIYLGLHSYNFFTFTFKGDQWIFSVLGLFTTSIGFILWLVIYLYAAEEGLERAVAMLMMFVSLGGEFAVAAFDMYMNIADGFSAQAFTTEDLRNMSYIIAGLALLNGLALVAGVAGQQIISDLSNVKLPWQKDGKQGRNVNSVTPVTAKAVETEQVTLSAPPKKTEERPAEIPFQSNGRNR